MAFATVRRRDIYYKQIGDVVFLLLCGGDKDTQDRDIKTALRMAKELPI